MKNQVILWIIVSCFFLLGIFLTIYSNKLTSWWLKQHKQMTDKIDIDAFKPTDDYRFNYKIGPIMFRILGILLIGVSIFAVFTALSQ